MIHTQKTRGWQIRLVDYLNTLGGVPFEFGKFDCAIMAGRAIHAMTGENPFNQYDGKYKTLAAGYKLVKKDGFASHIDFYQKKYPPLESIYQALPGDLAFVPAQNWSDDTIGIVQGSMIYVPAEIGITLCPLEMATSVSRI